MPTPTLDSIDHIHINVTDRAAAEIWYREVLGLVRDPAFATWVTERGPLTLANAANSLHLALFERAEIQNTVVAFKVSAAELVHWIQHLASNGIPVDAIDHGLSWSVYFRDPDGNPFEITTYEHVEFGRQRDELSPG